jgi:hypothetical protein
MYEENVRSSFSFGIAVTHFKLAVHGISKNNSYSWMIAI